MNATQLQAAAIIIKDAALQFLADKHSLTVGQVLLAIKSGNERASQQFNELVMAGVDQALKMAAE